MKEHLMTEKDSYLTPLYARDEFLKPAAKAEIPEGSLQPESAYQIMKDELQLDGRPGLNLATFVNTWMDDFAGRLAAENINKNFIDHEEYPQSNLAEKRSIWMLAKTYGTDFSYTGSKGAKVSEIDPDLAKGMYGAATIGSSEAIMLGLTAHKCAWKKRHMKNLKKDPSLVDTQDVPVVLVSAHAHTCFHKFCNYFGAVPLFVKMQENQYSVTKADITAILKTDLTDSESPYARAIQDAIQYLDLSKQKGRTIGELVMAVGAIVATTFTGNADPVVEIGDAINEYCADHTHGKQLDLNIPIHIDGASGGFVLPFSENGSDIAFGFKVHERVGSINTSNHKFGMTYPGMGSVIFRNGDVVDPSLVYDIAYLGGSFKDYTVNFSRGSSPILLQYYNFLRLGKQGYRELIDACLKNAQAFSSGLNDLEVQIEKNKILSGLFEIISDVNHFPIVVFKWKAGAKRTWSLTDLSDALREQGWIVPAYVLPVDSPEETPEEIGRRGEKAVRVMRAVFNQKVSADRGAALIKAIITSIQSLEKSARTNILPKPIFHGGKC